MSSPKASTPWTLSEKDWKRINLHVGLPDVARADIEKAIISYHYLAQNLKEKPSAREVRKRLSKTAAAAVKFAAALDDLTDAEHLELITSNFYWGEQLERQSVRQIDLQLRGVFQKSKSDVKMIVDLISDTMVASDTYSKKFPRAVNSLVANCDLILKKFMFPPISRSKSVMAMLLAVFKVADPSVTPSSVDEAVKRIAGGSLHTKKQTNSPQLLGDNSKR